MSAAGKKKRGESGASKGKSCAFRLGGGGVHPSALAAVMRTIGNEAEKIGRPRPGSAWDKPAHGMTYAEATAAEERRR